MLRIAACVGTLLLVVAAAEGTAQVTLRVVDTEGLPISAVRVDVFGTGVHLEQASTDSDGQVTLTTEPWSQIRRVSLRHVAYQPRTVHVSELPADGVVQLEAEALPLEGMVVEAQPELCPIVGTPEARELWQAVASLYASDTDVRALSGTTRRARERVPAGSPSRGELDGPWWVYSSSAGAWDAGRRVQVPFTERVRTVGYGWEPLEIGGSVAARDRGVAYPELEFSKAFHFATAAFGELHDFAIVESSTGTTTLAFCSNDAVSGVALHGLLVLEPAESFVRAEWRFHHPRRQDGAGGQVEFISLEVEGDDRPHLLARRGTFYRTARERASSSEMEVYRESHEHSDWDVLPERTHPCKPAGGRTFHLLAGRRPEASEFVRCVTGGRTPTAW